MAGRLDALRERPFRLLFLGQAVSLLGDGMVGVALAFAVLEETGSASESHSFIADLRDGWNDFRSRTWLWTTVASTTFGNMLFAAYFVLGPLVADRELGGAGAWALIASAFGVGLLVGGIVLLQMDPQRPALVATIAVALYTLPLAFLAIPTAAWVTAGAALLAGAGLAVANNLWETTQQRHVPEELLSRVSSYDWFGSLAAVPVGMVLWGPIADQIGVSTALWIAFWLQLTSILILLAVREIRELPAYPETARLTARE
jgi:predicted MFS family arabinose efflux permease